MLSVLKALGWGMQRLPGILALDLLPLVGFVAVSRKYSRPVRLLTVAAYALIAILAGSLGSTPFYWLMLAYLYFGAAGWVAHELLPYVRSRPAWFLTVALLFWALPSLAMDRAPRAFFILAWDFTLGAYSYGVDTRRAPNPDVREFLFFLFVNQTLVYRARGRTIDRPRSFAKGGAGRAALGVFSLFLSTGPMAFALAYCQAWSSAVAGAGPEVFSTLAVGALGLCSEYSAHSGLASLRIGCMRQMGYELPERYRYPLFASSPADFWRRWNTYVGGWAQAYVFVPLMLAIPSRFRRGRRAVAGVYGLAVIATFAVVGMLHDAFTISVERRCSASMTIWFLVMGLVVVVWEGFANVCRWRSSLKGAVALERTLFLLAACFSASRLP